MLGNARSGVCDRSSLDDGKAAGIQARRRPSTFCDRRPKSRRKADNQIYPCGKPLAGCTMEKLAAWCSPSSRTAQSLPLRLPIDIEAAMKAAGIPV
jgi:hypothetical protein